MRAMMTVAAPSDPAPDLAGTPFLKMHGLGNDFLVLDRRNHPVALTPAVVRALGDRHRGVGFDQLITLDQATSGAHAAMGVWNADGNTVGMCGNAARCLVRLLLEETGSERVTLDVNGRRVAGWTEGEAYAVDMGVPRLAWQDIPLAKALDTLHLPISEGPLGDPVATSLGNPHMTFAVADAKAVDLESLGSSLTHQPLYPEGANVGIAQVLAPDRLRVRVYERGAGITLACGSGACAALVAMVRRGLCDRAATLELDGGSLRVSWPADDASVVMAGPAVLSFKGVLA